MSWECVVGVEVHARLRTEQKLFCSDRAVFGADPNSHVCPVCLGLPGTLPTTNPEAVRLAVRMYIRHPLSLRDSPQSLRFLREPEF